MNRMRTVRLYLLDGDVTGRIRATLDNQNCVAFRIPILLLSKFKDEKHREYYNEVYKNAGIYLLFGYDDKEEKSIVYVGQVNERKIGKSLPARSSEHSKEEEKKFCNEIIFFTATGNELGATELNYLENRFDNLVKNAIRYKPGRYKRDNTKSPSKGNVNEFKAAELEGYIETAKVLMIALGYKVFEEDRPLDAIELSYSRTVNGKHVKATALWTNEGILVLKGSQVLMEDKQYLAPKLREERKKLLKDGKLSLEGKNIYLLKEDQLFLSPSRAACFVTGASENGRKAWITEDGKTIAQLEEEKLSSSTKSKNTPKK